MRHFKSHNTTRGIVNKAISYRHIFCLRYFAIKLFSPVFAKLILFQPAVSDQTTAVEKSNVFLFISPQSIELHQPALLAERTISSSLKNLKPEHIKVKSN